MSPHDLEALARQAAEAIAANDRAMTLIEPTTLLALVRLVAEQLDRIGVQGATIASQAVEIHRLKREAANA